MNLDKHMQFYSHHYNQGEGNFCYPTTYPLAPVESVLYLYPHLLVATNLIPILIVLLFAELHAENQAVFSLLCLFQLAQCFRDSTILFDVIADWYSIDPLHHSFFIHSPVDGHLDCLQFLAIMHKAALNICVQVFQRPLLGTNTWQVYICIHIIKKKLPHCFPDWLYHCAFPEQDESCSCYTALAALAIVLF